MKGWIAWGQHRIREGAKTCDLCVVLQAAAQAQEQSSAVETALAELWSARAALKAAEESAAKGAEAWKVRQAINISVRAYLTCLWRLSHTCLKEVTACQRFLETKPHQVLHFV